MNDEQKKAVRYNKGPLLIIAGAGTGKTTVITEKIKFLIKKKLAKPEEILALTFTEKAANEMEERVDQTMPYGYFQMWISTFHSFADKILKEEGVHIGLNSKYRLMSNAETILFLKKNLFLFNLNYFRPLGNPNKFLENLVDHFSRLKDEDISPFEYKNFLKKNFNISKIKTKNNEEALEYQKSLELANAYKTFQQIKLKENLLDFSDLIFYLNQLFSQRKNILKKYQKKFKYILIDEFQDTNIAQYNLIKLLCPKKNNPRITVVGDDSQAIYKFRGASVSNILNFIKDYKNAKQITLIKNYRSNQSILDTAYKLIKNNDPDTLEAKLGISKKLIAVNSKVVKEPVSFYLATSPEQEINYIISTINKLKDDYLFSDFAILARANNHVYPLLRALIQAGIPYQFLGPGMLLKQPEIKDLISVIKFLSNINDSPSFFRLINMEIFALDIVDINLLTSFSKKINQPLFQSFKICLSFYYKDINVDEVEIYKNFLPLLSKESKEKLYYIYTLLVNCFSRVKKQSAAEILFYFLEETGLLKIIANFKTEKEEKIALNITKFFNQLKTFETEHEDSSVNAINEFIDMSLDLGESPTISKTDPVLDNAVNILTVHSSKGLEFKVVFLINLVSGRFPTINRKETIPIPEKLIKEILPSGDYHLEEERRLFYVGLTRAKEKLLLTASKYYGTGQRQKKISPFLYESIDEKIILKELNKNVDQKLQLSLLEFKPKKQLIIKKNNSINTLNAFSYTQIETYERCPLQYKFNYILNIPTSATAALSFGNTIHHTLEDFYKEFLKNKSVDLNFLTEVYKKNWLPIGYLSKDHEDKMKKEGKKILESYFKKFHKKNLEILFLEKKFKIKIKDFYVIGKIDRIDRLPDNKIEIIDYKTGKKPEDKEIKNKMQLIIYTLTAVNPGLYKKNLKDVILSFFYLNSGEKISFSKTKKELQETTGQIIDIVSQIKSSNFNPSPGRHCDFCQYKMICDFWK